MSKEREGGSIDANIAASRGGGAGAGASTRAEGPRAGAGKQQINVVPSYSLQASRSSELYPGKGGMQIGGGLGEPPQFAAGAGIQQYHPAGRHVVQQQGSIFNTNTNLLSNSNNMMTMSVNNINTSTPCAACKLLRRRCAQECPFAPYFSPHEPQRFASVHKIYGASNVSKMLLEVPEMQRADTANSLVYEANARLRDPVYGCMGVVSTLQQQAQALQAELNAVKGEMMRYRAACQQALPRQHPHIITSAFNNTPATPTTPPLDHHPPLTTTPPLGADHYLAMANPVPPTSSTILSHTADNLDTKDRLISWP